MQPPTPTMMAASSSDCGCPQRALVALAYRALVGAPEVCIHGWHAFVERMTGRGVVQVLQDADVESALRASGARLIPGPVVWVPLAGAPIVDGSCVAASLDGGYWCAEWDVSVVVAWRGEGRPLTRQGRPHPRLSGLLMRGRNDPEWRAGGETIRRLAGRAAWLEYLARPSASAEAL